MEETQKLKIVPKIVNDIMLENDLVVIWRIRNVGKKRFTWRNSSLELHRRLEFWLVSDNLHDDVKTAEIGPSIKSDHSSVSLVIDSDLRETNYILL